MYEGQMGHYYNSQNALDNVAFTNENINNTLEMCQVMKESNEIQQKQMQKMDMDQMADIMDQQREMQMEDDMQLQNMMGQQPQIQQKSQQVNDPFLNNLNN